MRALLIAVALVLVVGVGVPGQVDARAPRAADMWGCRIAARPGFHTWVEISGGGFGPDAGFWSAAGRVGGCDRKRTLLVTASVWQHVEDGRNVLVANRRMYELTLGRGRWEEPVYGVGARECYPNPDEPPVAGAPFFMRMVVKRKHHAGKAFVATPDVAEPCEAPRVDY